MASCGRNDNFKSIVSDWRILEPDIDSQDIISVLACAILCCHLKCSTVVIVPMATSLMCQMSTKKGSCMEKKEAIGHPGSQMYQKKVMFHCCSMTFLQLIFGFVIFVPIS
jgi:hypothetical protein